VFLSLALWQIKFQVKSKSALSVNEKAMCLHYCCFLLFLLASLMNYIADLFDPPPEGLNINKAT
jgi:hypothetical protein